MQGVGTDVVRAPSGCCSKIIKRQSTAATQEFASGYGESLNLQMQPGASIERTLERRGGATREAEGKPAPLGRKGEERGENEEKTRSGSRVLEERKKRCGAKEKRMRGGRPLLAGRRQGRPTEKGKKTRDK
ncbi:hypothetical protein K0M31_012961 [Melipona bicolor]|uniref:Uncharacterized protein n=1 Tax=Melipona bicolor TaxID=60889 RepID=A0AA40FIU9_9HYME|nr:hypothetical protein K0M31_012961 [Melipona bicolor]